MQNTTAKLHYFIYENTIIQMQCTLIQVHNSSSSKSRIHILCASSTVKNNIIQDHVDSSTKNCFTNDHFADLSNLQYDNFCHFQSIWYGSLSSSEMEEKTHTHTRLTALLTLGENGKDNSQSTGFLENCLQCFDTVGWAAGRASSL